MASRHIVIVTLGLALAAGIPLLLRTAPAEVAAPASEQATSTVASPTGVAREVARTEAEELLRAGRPWRAAQLMREHLRRHPDSGSADLLLAARAEAGWGGWREVRQLLEGRDWLAEERRGEGLYLLARAREADGDLPGAAEAYRSYLSTSSDPTDLRTLAELRAALVLLRTGDSAEGRALLSSVRGTAPGIHPWAEILAAESLATRGDTAAVRRMVEPLDRATFGVRSQRARVISMRESRDFGGMHRLASGFRATGSEAARAEFALFAARASLELGQPGAAREELRSAISLAPRTASALEAARELERLGSVPNSDRLAIARVYDQHGQKARAAELYRAWLDGGGGNAEQQREIRLALGRSLFDAGNFSAAEAALRPLVGGSGDLAADALYLIGRAQSRDGRTSDARATYLRVAERFPGTQSGAEALYLVADMHHEAGEAGRARELYRRVADEFRGRDRAGLALMRLAGMAYQDGDPALAAASWDEYRTLYPRGQLWLQATYWLGITHAERGDQARAAGLFRAIRARDPLSYYALLATDRLGIAYWPVPLGQSPAASSTARERVDGWIRTVDLLRDADLHDEAEAEVDRLVQRVGTDAAVAYTLAEALNERGYTVRGIRLGLQLQSRADRLNERLLRILYPFPYRTIIEAEAREVGLDPLLSAALIRQESMFSARISSPVGARGLMQVMPATGRAVASSLGIEEWSDGLLFQPEINVHIGTRYLSDQMRTYDGSLPAVFSAYNAGPHRVEAWRRFPEFSNEELFTERIPFRETRDYVKILTRNLAIYEGLYGAGSR